MASNLLLLLPIPSNLLVMAINLRSDGLQPKKRLPVMTSNLKSDGLQPTTSDVLQPKK